MRNRSTLKFQKKGPLSLVIICVICLCACSRTSFVSSGTACTAFAPAQKIFLVTPDEASPADAMEVGTFEHLEDWNTSWEYVERKMRKKAAASGANIVKVDGYFEGSNTKGHGILMKGRFYRSALPDSVIEANILRERNKDVADCACSYLHVFRDEGNAGLRALASMNLTINDSLYGNLPDKKTYTIRLDKEGDLRIRSGNGPEITGRTKFGRSYYVQGTQVMGSPGPGIVTIESATYFVEHSLKAKVQFESLARTYGK